MRKYSAVIALLITLVFSLNAAAQSKYYVATNGSDTNTGTSLATPFASLAKAISVASVAGDTIFVRSGTYTMATTVTINKPGSPLKHYVLTVYKPDMLTANSRPVFDCSSMAASSSNRGINLNGANYWDIYGIVIKGAGDNGMNISKTSFTTVEFCSFLRNRDTGLQIGGASHDIRIINCDSYENADLGAGTTTNGGNADGFAPKLDVGENILFRGCRAWLNSDDAWDGYMRTGAPGVLDNVTTYLEDCWAFRNGYYWLDGSTNSSQNGNGFKMGGSDYKDESHNFVLVKCIAFDNKSKGFDQNNNAGSIYLYNCSGFRNLGNDYSLTSSTAIYKPGAELVLKNNLSLGAKGVSIPSASTSARTFITTTNSFKTAATSTEMLSLDTAGVTGRRAVDGSLPVLSFLRLKPTAALPYTYINQGTVLSTVSYHDVTGIPYEGAAPDLGAYESGTALPVSIVSFKAQSSGGDVVLYWKTAAEVNNKGWEIERMLENSGRGWMSLAAVNGAGNSSVMKTYQYTDLGPGEGTFIYRLKQTDFNGAVNYSDALQVRSQLAAKDGVLNVFPNPFKSSATLNYSLNKSCNVSWQVRDPYGRLVLSQAEEFQKAGNYQRSFGTSLLNDGVYIISLKMGDDIVSRMAVKN